jgi:TldD protein
MQALLEALMDTAARRADYADARYVRTRYEHLSARNGKLDRLDSDLREGVGVRVRVGGAWGFAAVRGCERADAGAALERALAVARAQPSAPGGELAPEPPARGDWASPAEQDPFAVSLEDKLGVLAAAEAALREQPGLTATEASFQALQVDRLLASTEGALCTQRTTECGGGLMAVAVDGPESQIRSYPASHGGSIAQAGYEHFLGLDLVGHAPRVAEEAVALLRAPACPAGRTTLILAGEQLGLQLHESVGHAVELDRVLGREASYAGTSFVPADGIGSLCFGSEHVDVTADATTPGALGSYRWDDEGVAGQAVPIVRAGVLTGFLSSRETAAEIGLPRSGGCMRADGFARQPIVRMTNVNLEPGEAGSFEDLIADTDAGVLVETNRSWSIDNRRLHFQFGCEAAWEIRGGERGRLLRNPTYAGRTPAFWASCDAVCSADEWRLVSLLNCGKGEPGQEARVSHGSAPARFRDVQVGVA